MKDYVIGFYFASELRAFSLKTFCQIENAI